MITTSLFDFCILPDCFPGVFWGEKKCFLADTSLKQYAAYRKKTFVDETCTVSDAGNGSGEPMQSNWPGGVRQSLTSIIYKKHTKAEPFEIKVSGKVNDIKLFESFVSRVFLILFSIHHAFCYYHLASEVFTNYIPITTLGTESRDVSFHTLVVAAAFCSTTKPRLSTVEAGMFLSQPYPALLLPTLLLQLS
jgi:hypothetical protein